MSKSLLWKLTLGFIVVALVTAGLVAIFMRMTSVDRLTRLIIEQQRTDIEASLIQYYTTQGSWDGIESDWPAIQWKSLRLNSSGEGTGDPGGPPMPTPAANQGSYTAPGRGPEPGQGFPEYRNLFGLADVTGKVIVAVDPDIPPGSQASPDLIDKGAVIKVNDRPVGTLLVTQRLPGFSPAEQRFLERTNQALLYAVSGSLLIALLIGVLLARTLIQPLHALTLAAQNIASGQLEQQVSVRSKDEIGQLAAAFNRMSQEVARSNQLRKQMTADIAHDLRTPLTVIGGYIESMREGVLQPTQPRLALIYTEIERLQNMVGDLRMLSQVDAGELHLRLSPVAANAILERAYSLFQHDAGLRGIELAVSAPDDLPLIKVDEDRMMQVFDNLLGNALRYTSSGGKISLSARETNGRMILSVSDTGSGISPDELPLIFNRFHRSDKSRHTENGESGLGLAIVKALVESQGGLIWAESVVSAGTTIHMEFPCG